MNRRSYCVKRLRKTTNYETESRNRYVTSTYKENRKTHKVRIIGFVYGCGNGTFLTGNVIRFRFYRTPIHNRNLNREPVSTFKLLRYNEFIVMKYSNFKPGFILKKLFPHPGKFEQNDIGWRAQLNQGFFFIVHRTEINEVAITELN